MFRFGLLCAAVAAILLPLALLLDPTATFYVDWYNNLWLTGITGEYLHWHDHPPTVLNTDHMVGMASPLFYGYLLYPLLGLISRWVGAHLALRLGCLLLVGLEFFSIYVAGRNVFRHRGLAFALATGIIWGVYSLTNLYNRSAVPEYFSTGLFIACISLLAAALAGGSSRTRCFQVWLAGTCATLTLGSHPPSAVLAAPLIGAALVAIGVAVSRASRGAWFWSVAAGCAAAVLGAVAVAPWVYLDLRFAKFLKVWGKPGAIALYGSRCDNFLGRFAPFPFDPEGMRKGMDVSTPYLEAPVAFALLILIVWLLFLAWRGPRSGAKPGPWPGSVVAGLALTLAWFGFLATLSLHHELRHCFPLLGPTVQFAYRLVSHLNVTLMIAALAAGWIARRRWGELPPHAATVVAAVCLSVSGVNVGIKLAHCQTVLTDLERPYFSLKGDRAGLVENPEGIGNVEGGYVTNGRVRSLTDPERMHAADAHFSVIATGPEMGRAVPVTVDLPSPNWVVTDAAVFPFSHVLANGRRVPPGDVARRDDFLAIHLPAGKWTLSFQWHPDPYWAALNRMAMAALAVLVAGSVVLGIFAAAEFLRPRRSGAPVGGAVAPG